MSNYNKNSGYGASYLSSIDKYATGKVRVVGDSNSANRQMVQEIFGGDADGDIRFYATIQAGVDACTADALDIVYVLPGYAETITSQIDMDTAGVRLVGLGSGSLRPTVTLNGTIDGFDVSAANVTIENIGFAVVTTDLATAFINVDAANCTLKNIYGLTDTTDVAVVDAITVTANADDLIIDGVEFWNMGLEEVNSFLSLEGAASRVTVKNFFAFGNVDTAGIIDAAKIDYLRMENIEVAVIGTAKPAITLDSNPEGYARNVFACGTHTTLATNCNMGNLMRLQQVWVTEETDGSKQGAQIPAVDSD